MLYVLAPQQLKPLQYMFRSTIFFGYMMLPQITYENGELLLIPLMMVFAYAYYKGIKRLYTQFEQAGEDVHTLTHLVEVALGQKASIAYQALTLFIDFAVCALMYNLLAQFVTGVLSVSHTDEYYDAHRGKDGLPHESFTPHGFSVFVRVVLYAAPVFAALSAMRDNHYFTDTAQTMKLSAFLVVCVFVLVEYFILIDKNGSALVARTRFNFQICEAFGVLSFAYHSSVYNGVCEQFKFQATSAVQVREQLSSLIKSVTMEYFSISLLASFLIPGQYFDVFLLNYLHTPVIFCVLLYIPVLGVCLPYHVIALKRDVLALWKEDAPDSVYAHVGVGVLLVLAAAGTAIAFAQKFALLLNLAGLAISVVAMLLPVAIDFKLHAQTRTRSATLMALWLAAASTSIVAVIIRLA